MYISIGEDELVEFSHCLGSSVVEIAIVTHVSITKQHSHISSGSFQHFMTAMRVEAECAGTDGVHRLISKRSLFPGTTTCEILSFLLLTVIQIL